MSELRPDQQRAFLCIVCGEVIDGLSAEQTKDAPRPQGWSYDPARSVIDNAVAYATMQNMEANEALILAHVEGQHTIAEVLVCLGTARNALMEIREVAGGWAEWSDLEPTVQRGLGGR